MRKILILLALLVGCGGDVDDGSPQIVKTEGVWSADKQWAWPMMYYHMKPYEVIKVDTVPDGFSVEREFDTVYHFKEVRRREWHERIIDSCLSVVYSSDSINVPMEFGGFPTARRWAWWIGGPFKTTGPVDWEECGDKLQ